ncbi:MAG TPA: L-dopachrome tautomerase-related protein [Bacteroidales bacterium]|nr:L-dopachrome tautomerase-related protein [Bacteroidales bacterium]
MKAGAYIILVITGFVFSSCIRQGSQQDQSVEFEQVASSPHQWTGLTVTTEGKIFVNFPRWSESIPMSVGVLNSNQQPEPFPTETWNHWEKGQDPDEHFICVQSVVADDRNRLWVLDPANPMFQGVVTGGAKLMAFNPQNGELLQKIRFDSLVVRPNSYLNDVRVDTEKGYAYITDSNDGAIVVADLSTGRSRRLLDDHYSTQPELPLVIDDQPWLTASGAPNFVASDGIALDRQNKYLYYHALSGLSLYRIDTRYLRDTNLTKKERASKVEFVDRTVSSDGMITGPDNSIYHSDVENSAVVRYLPDGKTQVVAQSESFKWPDTFSLGPDGNLYFTTSQIHIANPEENYKIFKIKVNAKN